MNKAFQIPVRGVGVTAPLKLSHSLVKFGAAVVGESLSSGVYLSNTSSGTSKQATAHCHNLLLHAHLLFVLVQFGMSGLFRLLRRISPFHQL